MLSRMGKLLAAAGVFLAAIAAAGAQDDPNAPTTTWKDSAELSFVVTSGNAETSTFALKNKLWRRWEKSAFEVNLGGLRSESTTFTLTATRDPGDPNIVDVDEDKDTQKTAEAYFLNARYDRFISDFFFWYVAGGWDRNEFAGIENRYTAVAGVGNMWHNTDHIMFRTDYAATWTNQQDVVADPDFDDKFTGVRLSYDYLHKLGKVTTYESKLILDGNVEETSDYRAHFLNSVAVNMSTHLALKVSYLVLYDHDPALQSVTVTPPGPPGPNEVLVELDEVDTVFTTSLVINY